MELIINIPEEVKGLLDGKAKALNVDLYSELIQAVQNGVVVPKGHGRLIDEDELDVITVTTDDYSGNEVLDVILKEDLDEAPTIIEADKGEKSNYGY